MRRPEEGRDTVDFKYMEVLQMLLLLAFETAVLPWAKTVAVNFI